MIRTEVVIPLSVLDVGYRFPAVCAKSGGPAETAIKRNMTWVPSWTYFFLLLGVLPFVIVYYLAGKKRTLLVPVTRSVANRRSNLIIAAWLSFGIAVVLPFFVFGRGSMAWLEVVPVFGVFWFGIGATRTWIDMRMNQHELTLRRVHPEFTTACQRTFPAGPPQQLSQALPPGS